MYKYKMSDKLIKEFIEEQLKLIKPPTHAKPTSKELVKPEQRSKAPVEDDLESTYNYIIEKKPAPKKVIKFLQEAIDTIMLLNDD